MMQLKTNRLIGMFVLIVGLSFSHRSYGYMDGYPSYSLKHGPFTSVPDKPLLYKEIPSFIKKDIGSEDMGTKVYRVNLTGNGMHDFVSFVHAGASPLMDEIHIYLKTRLGYREISFAEDPNADIRDIVDINHNGKLEVILGNLYLSGKHSYIAYSIYEVKNYRLVNADRKYIGFPKFVWYSNKKNDKDTSRLTVKERQKVVVEMNRAIEYRDIR